MIDRKQLLSDLQALLKTLEADLLERSESAEVPDVGRKLREEYIEAQAANRTAQNYEEWRSDAITQAAAAWVLSCVFVRFLEDNQLVSTPKIAGPGEGLKRARDKHELYFRSHPTLTDRDYLLEVFDELTKHAATKEVFGAHNPLRDLPNWLSGDAAGALITFFQRIDPNTGVLVHDFTDPDWDTRFLGDLYQDLSEEARKKYALLQTPVFVEEFILDRTLDPAIEEFGLAKMGYEARLLPDGRLHPDDRFKMIDPACGSGHFLLGSFTRLVDYWRKKEPGTKETVLVQRALDSVHGVDVNPYAVAIARFRLLLAALSRCGITRLKDAPGFTINLACGDSLLHGSMRMIQQSFDVTDELRHVYQPEDPEALRQLLQPGTYHAVIANPPYITPKDSALNAAYRERYVTCHRQYSLSVPFLERIVSLAVEGGYTGQITANSFMKREFGKKLIEEFLPRIDLTHVIDTSGAYIPGHGTPTVILFARNRRQSARSLRTVMGIRGEPATPNDPSRGLVWSAIVAQVDQPGSQSEFVSVGDSPREPFHKHPWSVGGGGAAELKQKLDKTASKVLREVVDEIGFLVITGEDNCLLLPRDVVKRANLIHWKPLADGEMIRDWGCMTDLVTLWPNSSMGERLPSEQLANHLRFLWVYRTPLRDRLAFSVPVEQKGIPWWCLRELYASRLRTPLSIVFTEIATHNHFVLDRGGKVFKQTAPVIKLPENASESDHLALLGLLNSSIACFWMKQVSNCKGLGGQGGGIKPEDWHRAYAFNGTKLLEFPVPERWKECVDHSRRLDHLASKLQATIPGNVLSQGTVRLRERMAQARYQFGEMYREMVALQEELDWLCYEIFGVAPYTVASPEAIEAGIHPQDRPVEILLQRAVKAGTPSIFYDVHVYRGADRPNEMHPDMRDMIQRRLELVESLPEVRLIETANYKRRWQVIPWEKQARDAMESWLPDRLESYFDFDGRMNEDGRPTARLAIALVSVGHLADIARQDAEFLQVGELYRDDPAFDVPRLVAELVTAQSVPLLPVLRYKPTGLRKRAEWETAWRLQRQEDAIDARTTLAKDHPDFLTKIDAQDWKVKKLGKIPVPPKYDDKDFLDPSCWRLRGKLDVPKARWVSFPHCEGEDGSLMVAWAGYDHLQLARAISACYVDVQERLGGRDDPRLVPLLACLIELLPWLKQWHNEVDPEFGVPMGDYFEGFLQEESRNLGLTLDEIKRWKPPERSRGRSPMKPKRSRATSA